MPKVGLAVAATALALAACSGRSALDVKRLQWEAERRGLDDQLDQLEERLLADQARVRFWKEMRERHESVSAVACVNLGRHAEGMALLDERHREKRDAVSRKNRVASRLVARAKAAQ